MPAISFSPSVRSSSTPVSDTFLLQYMPAANGSYVKVYLYFLHHSLRYDESLTTKSAAETLYMIESDVLEALRYWEEKGLLRIIRTPERMELLFLDGSTPPPSGEPKAQPQERSAPAAAKVIRVEQKPTYSPDELSIYSRDPQIQHLFAVASQYLGQVLSQPSLSTLYSFYDYYRLPLDVIEFLIQYCVHNGHRNLRYMEQVVQDWADQGIQTLTQAQIYVKRLDIYRPIMKTLGAGRYPTDDDCRTIDRWMNQYQMSMEMLLEACRRTRKRTNTSSFPYVEGILSDWHSRGIHTSEALKAADIAYEQKAAVSKENMSHNKTSQSKNQFLNYTQRNDVNYDDLEQELVEMTRHEFSSTAQH